MGAAILVQAPPYFLRHRTTDCGRDEQTANRLSCICVPRAL